MTGAPLSEYRLTREQLDERLPHLDPAQQLLRDAAVRIGGELPHAAYWIGGHGVIEVVARDPDTDEAGLSAMLSAPNRTATRMGAPLVVVRYRHPVSGRLVRREAETIEQVMAILAEARPPAPPPAPVRAEFVTGLSTVP